MSARNPAPPRPAPPAAPAFSPARAMGVLAFDLRLLARNRAHLLSLAWTILCTAALACIAGQSGPAPAPAAPRDPAALVRPALGLTGDRAWPELREAVAAHGFSVPEDADGAPLALAVSANPDGTVDVEARGVEEAPILHRAALRQALVDATARLRLRLLMASGLPSGKADALAFPATLPEALADSPVSVAAAPDPGSPFSLPDLSAQLALGIGVVGVTLAILEGFVVARAAGRLEILLSTRVTPAEYALSRIVLATGMAALVAAGVSALMPAAAWAIGEPYRPAGLGLLAAAPLAAATLSPLAFLGATRFDRATAASLAAWAAMSPFLAGAFLLAVANFLGIDPEWVAAFPLQGVSRWLQGREVAQHAAAVSAALTVAALAGAGWLACRTARARMFLQADA